MMTANWQEIFKSKPEQVLQTLVAHNANGQIIGCEGKSLDDWEWCEMCVIRSVCYMKLRHIMNGGED